MLRIMTNVENCQMLRIMTNEISNASANARIMKSLIILNLLDMAKSSGMAFAMIPNVIFFVEFKWRNDYMCAEGQALGFNLFLIMRAVICM